MGDNNNDDGFIPSIQGKPTAKPATPADAEATKPVPPPQKKSEAANGGTSDGFVPSVRAKSTPEGTETKEPGLLETANQYYEGRPAIPMAPTKEYASNLLHRIGSSLGRTAMIIPNMGAGVVHAVIDEPTLDDAGFSVQDRIAKRLLIDPSLRAIEQEKQHEEKDAAAGMPHKTPEKVLNRAVSAVPLIGPFVEGEGQRAGRGDIAGTVTDVGAMALIPEVAKEAMPGGRLPGAAAKGEAAFPTIGKVTDITSDTVSKAADIANKAKTPVGKILTDEAKQYALRKIPGYDAVKTAKRIANKISDLKEAENASALGKPADELIPSRAAKAAPTDPNLVDNSYIPSRSAKPAGLKPILPEEPTAEPAPEELKPIGSRLKPAKVEEELNRALGNEPLKRNVPLKDQGKPVTTEPEHLGQHARANGKWVNDLSEEDRAKVHDLSNVEVRQLAVNLDEDMGQTTVGRGKLRGEGSVTREEVFNRLLKNHTPAQIVKAIDAGKHLPKK